MHKSYQFLNNKIENRPTCKPKWNEQQMHYKYNDKHKGQVLDFFKYWEMTRHRKQGYDVRSQGPRRRWITANLAQAVLFDEHTSFLPCHFLCCKFFVFFLITSHTCTHTHTHTHTHVSMHTHTHTNLLTNHKMKHFSLQIQSLIKKY